MDIAHKIFFEQEFCVLADLYLGNDKELVDFDIDLVMINRNEDTGITEYVVEIDLHNSDEFRVSFFIDSSGVIDAVQLLESFDEYDWVEEECEDEHFHNCVETDNKTFH